MRAAVAYGRGGRRGRTPAAAAALLTIVALAAGGCAAGGAGDGQAVSAVDAAPPDLEQPAPATTADGGGTRVKQNAARGGAAPATREATEQAARPVRVRIPSIGVSTRVIALPLDANRKLVAPERFDLAGWNEAGPEPGEPGAAVVAGHVDSRSGPAVFFELRRLREGNRVHVDRADGTTVTFTVRRVARYPKRNIPDAEVYGTTPDPQLRLITCGGSFDRARRSYRDNIVVYATLR